MGTALYCLQPGSLSSGRRSGARGQSGLRWGRQRGASEEETHPLEDGPGRMQRMGRLDKGKVSKRPGPKGTEWMRALRELAVVAMRKGVSTDPRSGDMGCGLLSP